MAEVTAEIVSIYVDPLMRGAGAGTAVHDAALAHLVGHGFGHVVLWVLEANRSGRRFYESRGWSCDGARKGITVGGEELAEVRYSRSTVRPDHETG